jgi:hypothetical protein
MNRNFKRINLNDQSTFDAISLNDKIIYEGLEKEVKELVIKKEGIFFLTASRGKDMLSDNIININGYYKYNGHEIKKFKKYTYSEIDLLTSENYDKFNKQLKSVGI